jgi:pimeloyl-ACP methyl ester carboxylesterase
MRNTPVLVLRGALSDILSEQTVAEMGRRHPDLVSVEVPQRGHAPMLDEPEASAAIRTFLAARE